MVAQDVDKLKRVYHEPYYRYGRISTALADVLRVRGALALVGLSSGALIGIVLLFVVYQMGYAAGTLATDYQHLAWLVPVVTFLVAWGNRRS